MSISRWIVAVAFGLAASLGHAQENEPEPEVQPEATQQQPAEQTSLEPASFEPSASAPTDESSAEHTQSASADSDEDSYQYPETILGDGWAQWAMVAISFLALLVSAWAVWLLKGTLNATLDAVRSADEAVTVTRKIGDAQSRAYLHVQIANLQGLESDTPELAIGITNYGQTPARNIRIGTRRIVGDYRQAVDINNMDFRALVDLGPRQSTTVRYPLDADSIMKANDAGNTDVYAFIAAGRIKYVDQFCADDRETDFAFCTWHENKIESCQLDTRQDGNRST